MKFECRACHVARSRNLMEQLAPRHQIAKAPRSFFVGSRSTELLR
jgi:hypothetical protein